MKRALAVSAAFAFGCGTVVGAVVAYVFLPAPGGDLSDKPRETIYPVTMTDFSDQRTLPLVPTFSEGSELSTSASGVVTSSSCVPGQALKSGETAFSVSGDSIVALAADVPFYRDLSWGDSGADVDSLRRTLGTLGYAVALSGEFDDDIVDALAAIDESKGIASEDDLFHLTDFIWLPNGATAVESCEVKVGQTYLPGTLFAATTKVLTSLSVANAAEEGIVSGERAFEIFGVGVLMPEDGVLSDRQALGRIATSPQAKGKLSGGQEDDTASISGTSRLATPLRVAQLPAASIFGIQGTRGCVASDSGTFLVTIVGANLGLSQVMFDGEPPSTVLLQPNAEPCRVE